MYVLQYLLLFLIAICFFIITCAILGGFFFFFWCGFFLGFFFFAVWRRPVGLLNLFSSFHPLASACSLPLCNKTLTQLGKFMPLNSCVYRM